MNSQVPISGFDGPSRASRGIMASRGESSSLVSTERFRAVPPGASSSRLARSANASMPIASSKAWAIRKCAPAARRQVPT